MIIEKKGAYAPFFYTRNMKSYSLILIFIFASCMGLKAQTLKIMSYNIHVGQDGANKDQLKNIAEFIKSSRADIIGLQEVDSVCNRSNKVDQMKFLAEYTGMHYAYARHFAYDGGSYGIGILSRYPLSDIKDHRVILTSDGKSDAATRALLTAAISPAGKKITFATVHMDYRDSRSRVAQSEEMVSLFKGMKYPVILTGDFNAIPGTKEILNLETIFTDTGVNSDFTYPVVNASKKIDFVMVSKAHLSKVKKAEVSPVAFSDHLPIISTVKIKY